MVGSISWKRGTTMGWQGGERHRQAGRHIVVSVARIYSVIYKGGENTAAQHLRRSDKTPGVACGPVDSPLAHCVWDESRSLATIRLAD